MRTRRLSAALALAGLCAVITVPAGSATATEGQPAAAPAAVPAFTDVAAGSWYAPSVTWAVGAGVTTGVSATTFEPFTTTSRAMAITFLWRLAGSPTGSPTGWFTDVPGGSWYDAAAHWALASGVTSGKGGTRDNPTRSFGPADPVTRGQFVTMLWRLAGAPEATGPAGFRDTAPENFFFGAAEWAAFQGITNGYSGTTAFAPGYPMTRAEAVVFLKRYDNLGLPFEEPPGTLYNGDGPFKVGLRETTTAGGAYLAILYPVDPGVAALRTPTTSVSSADAFGAPGSQTRSLLSTLVPGLVLPIPVELYRDAPVAAAGTDGVVLSSHGFSGDPRYVLDHLSHYASWGYAVAAPSHPARNLESVVGGFLSGSVPVIDTRSPIGDLIGAYDWLEAAAANPSDSFYGKVDLTQVAAEGHSAGGSTIGETTVGGVADSLALRGLTVKTLIGWNTVSFVNTPNIPVLVVPGARDGVVAANIGPSAYYPSLQAPKQLVELANAGHNPVLDICAIIRARGGLGVEGTPLAALSALGEDGCRDGYALPALSTALIRHLAVAQVRWAFGQDATHDALTETFLRRHFRGAVGTTAEDLGGCAPAANFPDLSGSAGAGPGYAKPSVQVTCTATELVVHSNDMISYPFEPKTPNTLAAQDMTWRVPLQPAVAASPTSIVNRLGTLGFSVTGLPIYGPTEGPVPPQQAFGDPVANGILDSCKGHTGPQHEYHLHAVEKSTTCGFGPSPIIGYALDGFPIYGPRGCLDSACTNVVTFTSGYRLTGNPTTYSWSAYTYQASSDPTVLDACNGRIGPDGTYRYYATATFPYTFGCFKGTPTAQAGGAAAPMPPMG